VDVFEDSRLRVGLGEVEDVLEPVVVAVWVLERRVLRVPAGLEVAVRVVAPVAVGRGLLDAVFETRLLRVSRPVDRIDFVDVVLGLGSHVPGAERVDVVVFVDVFDCVEVDVGTMPRSSSPRA
jgi:hypothetical protein